MKKVTFLAAILAVGLSSCSKNEVTDVTVTSDNVDRIGVSTGVGTTRGTDMVGSSLQSHELVLSYLDSKLTPNKGTLEFVYDNTKGEWADNTAGTKWSALTLPAAFYSFVDGGGNVAVAADYAQTASLAATYSVADHDPEKHADLLYMSEFVTAVPVGGKIYSTFKHALSKVDLVAKVGTNTVKANYVTFNNLKDSGMATVTASTTNPILTWVPGSTTNYYESLDRKVALTANADPKVLVSNAIISDDSSDQSATANMKLIPQTFNADYDNLVTAIKGADTAGTLATADYSTFQYIEVMYRMVDTHGKRVVGFDNALDYPDSDKWDQDDKDKYSGKPLFVRVAFVLSNELALAPSNYYLLNLNFNTFGGLLMDDKYYDQNGDRTDLDIVADVEPGDPVIPSDDTVIGITVVVDEWTTAGNTDMQ